jgi:hypothetical protein
MVTGISTISAGLTTQQLANSLKMQAQSIRKRYCQTGSYFGVRPCKLPNGKLRWPTDSIQQLISSELDGSAA